MARRPRNSKAAARSARSSAASARSSSARARSSAKKKPIAKTRAGAIKTMKPAVILVGADKGGVGKTTVARALADYLTGKNIMTRAFDTESPRGTLQRFHGPPDENYRHVEHRAGQTLDHRHARRRLGADITGAARRRFFRRGARRPFHVHSVSRARPFDRLARRDIRNRALRCECALFPGQESRQRFDVF